MNLANLLWGLLFSSIGIGYFIYGRKQDVLMAKYSGIALMVYPYFVTNSWFIVLIGAACMALPFIIEV